MKKNRRKKLHVPKYVFFSKMTMKFVKLTLWFAIVVMFYALPKEAIFPSMLTSSVHCTAVVVVHRPKINIPSTIKMILFSSTDRNILEDSF